MSGTALRYGPWALVTGASSGIGEAFARHLALLGFNLALVSRREDVLTALAARLHAEHGIASRVIALDVAESTASSRLSEATSDLDIGLLVAAAGFGTSGRFLDIEEDAELEMIAVNCTAVLRQCRSFGKRFAERGSGGIVLMGSLLGWQGVPRSANYAATKAYVQSLAEGLRGELRVSNVDVISCAPGPVTSGFGSRAGMKMKMGALPETVAAETIAALGKRTTVVPGSLSKLLTYSLAPLNRGLRTRILAGIMADMTSG